MIIFKTCRTPPSSGHAEPARFPLYSEMYYPFRFTTSVNSPPLQVLLRMNYYIYEIR